jgi:hypothetical protein
MQNDSDRTRTVRAASQRRTRGSGARAALLRQAGNANEPGSHGRKA